MMHSAQVVETSVNVTTNSPSQDYAHLDDHNLLTYGVTPGFKPSTVYGKITEYPVCRRPSGFANLACLSWFPTFLVII